MQGNFYEYEEVLLLLIVEFRVVYGYDNNQYGLYGRVSSIPTLLGRASRTRFELADYTSFNNC